MMDDKIYNYRDPERETIFISKWAIYVLIDFVLLLMNLCCKIVALFVDHLAVWIIHQSNSGDFVLVHWAPAMPFQFLVLLCPKIFNKFISHNCLFNVHNEWAYLLPLFSSIKFILDCLFLSLNFLAF